MFKLDKCKSLLNKNIYFSTLQKLSVPKTNGSILKVDNKLPTTCFHNLSSSQVSHINKLKVYYFHLKKNI